MVGSHDLHLSAGDGEIADLFWTTGLKQNSARMLTMVINDVGLIFRDIEGQWISASRR